MRDNRGLSQVVTTIVVILLILVSVGIIWGVVNVFLNKGAESISLDSFMVDLKIESAKINYSSGIASIKVARGGGDGELSGIKIVVEDERNSEVFEESAADLAPLAKRTYDLDLGSREFLDIATIKKIYIAPVYVSGSSGIEKTGAISDTISGDDLNTIGNISDIGNSGVGDSGPIACNIDSDCGSDTWIDGTRICSDAGENVMQYMVVYSCVSGFCNSNNELRLVESCASGATCYNGQCIDEAIPCTDETVATDCGVDGWVGLASCNSDNTAIIQDWQSFECVDNQCVSTISTLDKLPCADDEVCFEAECFVPLECASDSDCDLGKVCEDGSCVNETLLNNGTVRSAWPYGVSEYFDSLDLPKEESANYSIASARIIFPNNPNVGCLSILHFQPSVIPDGASYVQLSAAPTNVTDGDYYEIWKTSYACTLI